MADKEVRVYSTPTCPWCKKAKQFLDANKVSYQDLDVAHDAAARKEMINKSSQTAVPTIIIDGDIVIGFNEPVLKEKLGIK
ncbi:MAG: glutaredoxin domain-containing protein [Dehalococcoidia bacterium]|jgi:glutaredoxin